MEQTMRVLLRIWESDGSGSFYQDVLWLPTHWEAIKDAYQRARVSDEHSYDLKYGEGWPQSLVPILQRAKGTLEEANLLAFRLSQMSEMELWTYEAALETLSDRTMKTIINASYNLNCFEFLPGILCDKEIGEMTIENNLDPVLKELPEKVSALLDETKVGAFIRKRENGAFTRNGYGYSNGEPWREVYDKFDFSKPLEGHRCLLALHLLPIKSCENQEQAVWLELPYGETERKEALCRLGAESLEQCEILEIRSAVPHFETAMNREERVSRFNLLAKKLSELPENELLKLKAVVEVEGCDSAGQALELIQRLDQYELDIHMASYDQYGRECLEGLGIDLTGEAFQEFDFERYGKEESVRTGRVLTDYGAIQRVPAFELELQEDGLQMGGME